MAADDLSSGMDQGAHGEEPDGVGQEDWYWGQPLTLEELGSIFPNPKYSDNIRENAFLNYWLRLLDQRGFASRQDLEALLAFPRWIYAINENVYRLCVAGRLLTEDAQWLSSVLEPSTFGYEQVQAYLVQMDASLGWEEKLTRALELRADWLAERVLRQMPLSEATKARELIASSGRPRRSRHDLRTILDERERELRRIKKVVQSDREGS